MPTSKYPRKQNHSLNEERHFNALDRLDNSSSHTFGHHCLWRLENTWHDGYENLSFGCKRTKMVDHRIGAGSGVDIIANNKGV